MVVEPRSHISKAQQTFRMAFKHFWNSCHSKNRWPDLVRCDVLIRERQTLQTDYHPWYSKTSVVRSVESWCNNREGNAAGIRIHSQLHQARHVDPWLGWSHQYSVQHGICINVGDPLGWMCRNIRNRKFSIQLFASQELFLECFMGTNTYLQSPERLPLRSN